MNGIGSTTNDKDAAVGFRNREVIRKKFKNRTQQRHETYATPNYRRSNDNLDLIMLGVTQNRSGIPGVRSTSLFGLSSDLIRSKAS